MSQIKNKTPKPLRCLVTGGLGYAGAWISERLAAAGHEVFILSRGDNKADIGQAYTLIQADLENMTPAELCFLLPEPLDCVVHAASYNEAFDPDYPRKALLANCLGTRNLLESLVLQAKRHALPMPFCIYLSTFHVYGLAEGHINENTPPTPKNDYAITHYFAEEYCSMFERLHAMQGIILRLSNGYGAPKTPNSSKWYLLLNDLCKSAVIRGEVLLRSDPSQSRDFVWLGDVAEVVEKLVARRDLAGRTFNVSSGKAMSIGEVAQMVSLTASQSFKRLVPVVNPLSEDGLESAQPRLALTPSSLYVSNKAICSALDFSFQDRMREEVTALLELAGQTQTAMGLADVVSAPLRSAQDEK